MRKPLASILIPAHNEEKVIGKALDGLKELRKSVKSFEVLVGLDGCTDGTEKIVRSYKFPKIFVRGERGGKHVMINFLQKKAKTGICIVHDADLQFNCSKKSFEKMLGIFRDPDVGCIADNYTVNYDIRNKKGLSALYLGDLWNMYFLLEYKTKKFAAPYQNNLLQVPGDGDAKYFFFVNIFRKKFVNPQRTLCDDGERLFDVLAAGKKAVLLPLMQKPYLVTSIETVSAADLITQKYRGAIARKQIAEKYGSPKKGLPVAGYALHVLKNIPRIKSTRAVLGVFLWWAVALYSLLGFSFSNAKTSTREGWGLRIARS